MKNEYDAGESLIPTPRPGDMPETPERPGPPGRGLDINPLLFQSLQDIEELKKTVKHLEESIKNLERRLQTLEEQKI